jgi:hypothetical protein
MSCIDFAGNPVRYNWLGLVAWSASSLQRRYSRLSSIADTE